MDNNNIDKNQNQEQDKDKSFITEKIKPKTRRKIKKILEVSGLALLAALIIGFVSRLVFVMSETPVNKILGVEEKQPETILTNAPLRNEVKLSTTDADAEKSKPEPDVVNSPNPTPEPVMTPEGEKNPSPSPSPVEEDDQSTVDHDDKTGEAEEKSEDRTEHVNVDAVPIDPASGEGEEGKSDEPDPMENYNGIVGSLKDLYSSVSECVVTVRSCTSGINWLDENIETYTDGTGVVLGENGVELLVMTSYTKTDNADRIEIILSDGFTIEGRVFLSDPVLDLAIVAVELEKITSKEKSMIRCICIGDSSKVSVGDSVMAAGMPDGYSGSMAYGFVSATGRKCYVQDGVLDVFATGLPYHPGSDAVIVNMSGEMIGIISHYAEQSEDDRITTCIAINSIRDILIALLNGKNAVHPGIRAEDMPADVLGSMGLENGIYINEVTASSPAANAGLRKGDVITEMNGSPIKSVKDMMALLAGGIEGDRITTKYFRSSLRDEPVNTVVIELASE